MINLQSIARNMRMHVYLRLIEAAVKRYGMEWLLFGVSLATVWQMLNLWYVPETPAQDLAKHIASILNFKDAFLDGQYLPRMQLPPNQVPDIPLFQFYGSLLGFICLPFLLVGFSPITSLVLGVLFVKWIGALAVHNIGKLIGANAWSSSLGAITFLLTPYLISNFYGRVAVPETIAHSVIAILFYGIIRVYVRRIYTDAFGVLVTGLSIVALSLAHPIFLLYGFVAAFLFSVMLSKTRFLIIIGLVLTGGILLASFQWLPGFLYREDFAANFTGGNPFHQRHLTSLSGLLGTPHSLADEGISADEIRLFLTPGIFTLPVLLLLAFQANRPLARATLGVLSLSLFASYSPIDFWKFLPEFFWAVQFPYRLLAFVALFTSIGVALTLKHLRPYQWLCLVGIVIVQSATILLQVPYSKPLEIAKDTGALREAFANQDYVSRSNLPLRWESGDGWLLHYAASIYDEKLHVLHEAKRLVDEHGTLLSANSFSVGAEAVAEKYLRIAATLVQDSSSRSYAIWIAESDEPNRPVDGIRFVKQGRFEVQFKSPNNSSLLTIQCSHTTVAPSTVGYSKDCPPIKLERIESMPGNGIIVLDDVLGTDTIEIQGASIFPEGVIDLWLASSSAPELPVSKKVSVGPGEFSTSLTIPRAKGVYMLVASRYLVPADQGSTGADYRRLSVSVKKIKRMNQGAASVDIASDEVTRIERNGYRRVFRVMDPQLMATRDESEQPVTIEIPMAFSRLINVTQRGVPLSTTRSENALISVRTHDPSTPIVARFTWPGIALCGTLVGFLILGLLMYRVHTGSKECEPEQGGIVNANNE
jgi:hypothetical protein